MPRSAAPTPPPLDEIGDRLRAVFRTANTLTLPISGTGSAGMEACFVNLVEPGDTVIVGVNGVFGERMCEVARRSGAEVIRVEAAWGEPEGDTRLVRAQAELSVQLDAPQARSQAEALGQQVAAQLRAQGAH